MSIFAKSDSTSKLESELARLEKKRTALAGRLVSAQSAETAAIEARRKHLVDSDDEDFRAGAKFTAAVDAAQRDRIAIEDAIGELDRLIAEGRAAVIAARESAARAKRASEIETKIKKIEPMAAEAESLFEKLADLMSRIVELADCPDLHLREYRIIQGPGSPLPAATLAGAALTEALFRSLPDGFSVSKMPTATYAAASLPLMVRRDGGLSPDLPLDTDEAPGFRPLPLSGALTENVIAPLKQAATEILDGSRPITTTAKIAEPEDEGEPVFDWSWVVFVKPARWQDWKGETVTQADSRAMVPQPVALAAIAAGVAFPENSSEAQGHEEWRYQRGFHNEAVSMGKETVTLDVRWPATTRAAA